MKHYLKARSKDENEQPGGASGKADLKAKGYTVREISGPDAKVYDNEFKIALRVGTQPYAYNQYTMQ